MSKKAKLFNDIRKYLAEKNREISSKAGEAMNIAEDVHRMSLGLPRNAYDVSCC